MFRDETEIIILHGNLIESSPGRFVAYFDEFPEIVAQGKTEQETRKRLLSGLKAILQKNKKGSDALKNGEYKKSQITHFEVSGKLSSANL